MKSLKAKLTSASCGLALAALMAPMMIAPSVAAGDMGALFAKVGPAVKEMDRSVSDFSAIRLRGPIDVRVKIGNGYAVTVKASDGMMEKVITEVKGDTLDVHLKRNITYNWRNHGPIVVYVTLPKLEALTTLGSGDMSVSGPLSGSDLNVSMRGSGDISIDESMVKNLDIDLSGSGDVMLESGSCATLKFSLRGSGDIAARGLKCDKGDFKILGSGDISAYTSVSVKANILGSGDVTIYGNPEDISSTTRGSGSVRTR